ncbi:MAG TPA: SDR family oxidoreductase [Acidimicrobiia bacterium]|nr:SDR family oxidoreductase [Acidimicrobiia bacterium]
MTVLSGSHVLVTGGSSGIGLAVARAVVARGGRVSIVARDAARLRAAQTELDGVAGAAGRVASATADVADGHALREAVAQGVERLGPVDVLVTSAGYAHPGLFVDLDDEVFRRQVAVNYLGTVNAIRAVLPTMVDRRRGHLLMVSSTVGLIGLYGYAAYAPTKFAVRGLAESLRSELRPHGIVVACAYPPDTETPALERERAMMPAATASYSAKIKPRTADAVAAAIVRGIERDRLTVTADVQTAALARVAGLLGPYLRRSLDRVVRRAAG